MDASDKTIGNAPGKRIIFPVLGKFRYSNSFGDPRGQGAHQGIDIMAPRKALALAAEAGKVKYHITSSRAGCMLYLYGDSGTTYLYIHLNNDLGKTNDNRGRCARDCVRAGSQERRACRGRPADRFRRRLGRRKRDRTAPPLRDAPRTARPSVHSRPQPGVATLAAPRNGETSLWLKGSVLAQQPEAFKVRVNSLAVRATGLKLNGISRPVSLGVETYTLIETAVGGLAGSARATVWTEIAPVTLAAQLGRPARSRPSASSSARANAAGAQTDYPNRTSPPWSPPATLPPVQTSVSRPVGN